MDVQVISRRKPQLGCLLLIIVFSSVLLNLPTLYFEPLDTWVCVGVPMALLVGFIGSVWKTKVFRVVGWVGVFIFLLVTLTGVRPGEDYTLGGPGSPPGPAPHLISDELAHRRWLLFGGTAAALIACYVWAGRSEHPGPRSSQ